MSSYAASTLMPRRASASRLSSGEGGHGGAEEGVASALDDSCAACSRVASYSTHATA
eukprot:CAMPEP_0113232310 /NCGR_PEP_ID=MMETSP0008_2-20120614/1881_1 /TAXON_ID=97485 /ORGANISM="Prymnesium parvum" /LENGTH=56 /DNA_ID=CAMNT_0000079015 /DNA_START=512 /DNA_END=682 /DNA_ORIENTATION=- /assembly_acc=CAM_ASM_000153